MKKPDLVIIGAGPAGLTAAIYARRAGKTTLILEGENFGGQITHSPKVENYPGFPVISGMELADKLTEQVMALGAEIELDRVTGVEKTTDGFAIHGEAGDYAARAVIVAAGSHHRVLGLPGEEALVGNGISYCAICDGAFYAGRHVAVIGGGNTALQEAVMLSEYCASVTLIQNLPFLTGEESLAALLRAKENVRFLFSHTVAGLIGEELLTGLLLRNSEGKEQILRTDGVFVAIGQVPENTPFADVAELDERGYFASDESCATKTPGLFVAGDCRNKRIRQITTATADGAVAALAACRYLDDPAVQNA